MLLYEEDFTDPGDEWTVEDDTDVEFKFDGETYSIEVRKENWMAWDAVGDEFADFALDFDVVLVEGDEDNAGGCLFRYQDRDNYYELGIDGYGSYFLSKDVDDESTPVIEWTSSAALKPFGEVNHVRLIAYGDTFSLYVNDQFVDEFTDTFFLSGDIAPVVTAYDNPPVRAKFDNIKIWDVELR